MKITDSLVDGAVLREVGRRLALLRLQRNQTQAELAREAGIGERTLKRLEGGSPVTLSAMVRTLRALGRLHLLDQVLPEPGPSPLQVLALKGRARQRASGSRREPPAPRSVAPRPWGDELEGDRQ